MIAALKQWAHNFAKFVIVLIICAAIFGPMYCDKYKRALKGTNADTTVNTTIVIDSTEQTITAKPQYIRVVDSIPYPVQVLTKVDTAAILERHFTAYVYSRELRDSNLVVTLTDTITQNSIKGYSISYKILKPCVSTETIITKHTQPEKKNSFYIGIGSGSGTAQLNPSLLWITKNKSAYSIQNNVLGAQPNLQLTAFFKLK